MTVNRLCGSSLQAAMDASRLVETGDAELVVAGGVESMSRAPWVLPKPSRGFPAGNETLVSTTLGWRLVNPRMPEEWTVSLGECNEQLADALGIGRERQDAFAVTSHQRAAQAWDDGFYDDLVLPVDGLARDECVRPDASVETLAGLKPAFRPDGTITAGNASPLNDGAAALLIGGEDAATGLPPLARIAGRGAAALEPQRFGIAPVEAADRALAAAGHRLVRHRRGGAQRGVRGPVLGLPRRVEDRPGDRQHPRRRDRHRSPARRLGRPRAQHAGRGPAWSAASAGVWPRSASASARASRSCWRTSPTQRTG